MNKTFDEQLQELLIDAGRHRNEAIERACEQASVTGDRGVLVVQLPSEQGLDVVGESWLIGPNRSVPAGHIIYCHPLSQEDVDRLMEEYPV
jgi:hypothetical protein